MRAAFALLLIAPYALHFSGSDKGLTAFHLGGGIAVLAAGLITNYQYSPKRQTTPAIATA